MYTAVYTTFGGVYVRVLEDEDELDEFLENHEDIDWLDEPEEFAWEHANQGFIIEGEVIDYGQA